MDIREIKRRDSLHTEGVWVNDIADFGDAAVLVRTFSAPVVMRAVANAPRLWPDLSQEDRDRMILLDYVLLDWKGFTDGGKEVPYSREQAAEWMEVSLFEAGVRRASVRAISQFAVKIEEDSGNSEGPSD